MKKSEVNGNNVNEVYKWLKNEKSGLLGLSRIKVRVWSGCAYTSLPKYSLVEL
jgi:glutathione peroxidase-family protein